MVNPTLQDVKIHMVKVRQACVRTGDWVCCLNCEEWRELTVISNGATTKSFRCARYEARPPDEVIVVGCQEHVPAIPF